MLDDTGSPMRVESDRPQSRTRQSLTRGVRVLVVDDQPDLVLTFSTMLQMCGFVVRTAANGRSALTIASEFRPRFVLLDLGLPALDGYEVARRLRADAAFQSSTLIAVTAYSDEESRRRTQEVGFDAHLVKPVKLQDLLETLSAFGAESAG